MDPCRLLGRRVQITFSYRENFGKCGLVSGVTDGTFGRLYKVSDIMDEWFYEDELVEI